MFHPYSILQLLKLFLMHFFSLLAFCLCLCGAENWPTLPFCIAFYSGKYYTISKLVCICLYQLVFSHTFEKVQENSSVSGCFNLYIRILFKK